MMDETVERIRSARKAACDVLVADDNIAMPLIKLMDVSRQIIEKGLQHSSLEENINNLISDAVRTRRQDESVDPVRGLLYDALEVVGRTFMSIRSTSVLNQVLNQEDINDGREVVEQVPLLDSTHAEGALDPTEVTIQSYLNDLPSTSQALLTPKFEDFNSQLDAFNAERMKAEIAGSSMEEANYSFTMDEEQPEDMALADEEDSYRGDPAWPETGNSPVKKRKARNEWHCADCGDVYTSRASLRVHARTHKDNMTKDYVCADCGRSYRSSKSLSMHKTIHKATDAERRPFACTLCIFRTNDKSTLRKHIRRHSNDNVRRAT